MNNARREVICFLILTFAFSAPFYAFVVFAPNAASRWTGPVSHLFMWTPGVAAVITSLIFHRSLSPLGFRLGKLRYYIVSYAVPIGFCLPVYLTTWLTGLGAFNWPAVQTLHARFPIPSGIGGAALIIVLSFLLAPLSVLATAGEEIGWSGLLSARLAEITTFGRASLIRGLIWSLWHYPVIIVVLPRYRPDLPLPYALACMTVAITAISFIYTWLRIASGSLWPGALLHAVSSVGQEVFEYLTVNTGLTHYITYEFGAGFALVLTIMAIFVYRRR